MSATQALVHVLQRILLAPGPHARKCPLCGVCRQPFVCQLATNSRAGWRHAGAPSSALSAHPPRARVLPSPRACVSAGGTPDGCRSLRTLARWSNPLAPFASGPMTPVPLGRSPGQLPAGECELPASERIGAGVKPPVSLRFQVSQIRVPCRWVVLVCGSSPSCG